MDRELRTQDADASGLAGSALLNDQHFSTIPASLGICQSLAILAFKSFVY